MKNIHWILIFAAIFAFCLVLVLLPSGAEPSSLAQIRSGSTVTVVDLQKSQELTFRSDDGGYNIVTVRDGKIAVTEANCPDQYCVRQGFCDSGEQIVCLPHKLVISFLGNSEVDGAAG